MKIVHISNTDPAGAAYNFIRAINEHTPHRARLITTQSIPGFDFPKDVMDIFDSGDESEALLKEADVIHFHKVTEDNFKIEYPLEEGPRVLDLKDYIAGKKIVYHIHGAPSERNFIKETVELYSKKGRPVLCSTPDLEEIYKPLLSTAQYFPNCVPINDVKYLPRATDKAMTASDGKSKRYCVFQSGTHAILKNVHVIRDVMEKLAKELPVFFLHTSPEQIMSQDLTLRHKRIAHVVFDHIEGYYGLSSLEALSMGKPTIAGLNDYCIKAICNFFGWNSPDALPWIVCHNADEIEAQIRRVIGSEQLRLAIGEQSRRFMEEVWSDASVAKRLADFYQSL